MRCLLWLSFCVLLSCQRSPDAEKQQTSGAATSRELDGMQLESARRVGLESAVAAMKARDLQRLKQLSTWVRGRAQVAIFAPDDLMSLDLAIQCLEQASQEQSLTALDQIKSGKLREPARAVCQGSAPP